MLVIATGLLMAHAHRFTRLSAHLLVVGSAGQNPAKQKQCSDTDGNVHCHKQREKVGEGFERWETMWLWCRTSDVSGVVCERPDTNTIEHGIEEEAAPSQLEPNL